MEFSFDRSKEAHLRRPEAQSANAAPEPQTTRPGPDLNTVDPSTIANDRLRKAIERNRAKQAGRESLRPAQPVQEAASSPAQETHHQDSFFSNAAQETMSHAQQSQQSDMHAQHSDPEQVSPRVRVRERAGSTPPPPPRGTTVVSRRSVAKPDDQEFVPVKRTTRKVASQISYTTNSSATRKKSKSVDPKYLTWLVKGSWIFCGLMILRLIFASGGVTDFYSQKNSVSDRLAELASIKKENMQLVREIERMRTDTGFQKKLVRDNLGFIASDEFLVLFPKER